MLIDSGSAGVARRTTARSDRLPHSSSASCPLVAPIPGAGSGGDRDGDVHLRYHRASEGRRDKPACDCRRSGCTGARVALDSDDTLVHGLPLFHVHGLVLGLLGSLRSEIGSCTGKPTPGRMRQRGLVVLRCSHGVVAVGPATPLLPRPLSSARLLVSGSAALPVPVFSRLVALTGHARWSADPPSRSSRSSTRFDGERRPGWVGLPVDGVQSRIVGDDGSPVASDR